MQLVDFSTREVFSYFLVLCRIGGSVAFMSGISEPYISPRIRLAVALVITYLAYSTIKISIPLPATSVEIVLVMLSEIGIGVAFGLSSKILLSGLYIAGHAISANIGLSSAMMFDPNQGDQGALIGNFLGIVGLVIVLGLNLHISIINSLIQSYETLSLGSFFKEFHDFHNLIMKAFQAAWNVGIRLAAPFIIMSLVTYLGTGVLARLMPQLQVFFLLIPAQILAGLFVMLTVLSTSMIFFVEEYQAFITEFMNL